MKVFELSKEFDVTNKEMIDFLKGKGYKVSSHNQTLTDEMIDSARKDFMKSEDENKSVKEEEVAPVKKTTRKAVPAKTVKHFEPTDMIRCHSVSPWPVVKPGANQVYRWPYFGYEELVAYRDLQSWKQSQTIKGPEIIIDDPDLCELWKNDLDKVYKMYFNVSYPEEFFDVEDEEFEDLLKKAPKTFQEVIKYTAMDMIRNENYPSIQKIKIIDDVLKTGIIEFVI